MAQQEPKDPLKEQEKPKVSLNLCCPHGSIAEAQLQQQEERCPLNPEPLVTHQCVPYQGELMVEVAWWQEGEVVSMIEGVDYTTVFKEKQLNCELKDLVDVQLYFGAEAKLLAKTGELEVTYDDLETNEITTNTLNKNDFCVAFAEIPEYVYDNETEDDVATGEVQLQQVLTV